jgi:predicted metal-dependent HD superfamily phosphohydrolase
MTRDSSLLLESWLSAWAGGGACHDGSVLGNELLLRYSEPQRRYHSRQHLSECLAAYAEVRVLAVHPAEVELALWFHDAIYDIHRHDNEERSAEWARTALLDAGVEYDAAQRVAAMVLATRHAQPPTTADEQLIVDIDLAILGAAPERYAEYERQVRAEYAFVPGWLFGRKRRAILRSFRDRTYIYGTEHFRTQLEERARANIGASLQDSA